MPEDIALNHPTQAHEVFYGNQCQAANVFPMILLLILQASRIVKWSHKAYWIIVILIVLDFFYIVLVRRVNPLSFAHLCMSMLALDGAIMSSKAPLFVAGTWAELCLMIAALFPNVLVVLDETIVGFRPSGDHLLEWHSIDTFARTPFFRKQHAILHSSLTILILSFITSFFKRLRHSRRMQLVRIFVEPSCAVAVAQILFTHDHGDMGHDLSSHPAIGAFMCAFCVMHIISCTAHLSYPSPTGGTPDLTVPLPGGGPAPLRMLRLLASFTFMLASMFLAIDTIFEYTGCRDSLIKIGEPGVGARKGLNSSSELSTYLAAAFVLSGIMLGCIVFHTTVDDDDDDADRDSRFSLLASRVAPAHSPAELSQHDEGGAGSDDLEKKALSTASSEEAA